MPKITDMDDENYGRDEGLDLGEIDFDESEADASNLPSRQWLQENFKSASAAIRYLRTEFDAPVGLIAKRLGLKYRHVYSVAKKEQSQAMSDAEVRVLDILRSEFATGDGPTARRVARRLVEAARRR